jgi:hypothetical protein
MSLEESLAYLKENVYGEGADDTIALGLMLAQLTEQTRIGNLLKMQELGLISIEEQGKVTLAVREAVGLESSSLKLNS